MSLMTSANYVSIMHFRL